MLPEIKPKTSNHIDEVLKKYLKHNHKELIPIGGKMPPIKNVSGHHTVVHKIELLSVNQTFALKVKAISSQEKERELLMLRKLSEYRHPNIIYLQHHFITQQNGQKYINMLTEYMPINLKTLITNYKSKGKPIPVLLIKLFSYQMVRGVAYLHLHQICHRNLQPENILIDNSTFDLRICDFSQAKHIQRGEQSICQVNSVNYRAPELLVGSQKYSQQIDIWALGCMIMEMQLQRPLFDGVSQEEVFSEIIKLLGTPSNSDFQAMQSPIEDIKLPLLNIKELEQNEVMEFCKQLLKYKPQERGNAIQLMANPFFRELRQGNIRLNGSELPNILNFNKVELQNPGYQQFIK